MWMSLLLVIGLQRSTPVAVDRIMAVVAAQPILLSDVTAATEFHLVDVPPGTADPTRYVLERLIRRTLILTEVNRFQPPPPDEIEITTRVDDLARRAGSSDALAREFAVTGLTRDQLRQFIRDDLRIRTYILQRFGANLPQAQLDAQVDSWVADLRRRTDVSVIYQAK